jgi:2-polyprenyl-3-methyl-5-hydroxy-6-metoxy-1,4-benzoquinol methylase
MSTARHAVATDPVYGYRHLEPIPNDESLREFYESRYYDLLRRGGRAPELRRMLEGGETARREREWLEEGMYTDIVDTLRELRSGERLLEVGCGTGEFLDFARRHGFEVAGIEPAREAVQKAAEKGLNVHGVTLEGFVEQRPVAGQFSAVVLLNVLEHVPDPVATVRRCRDLMAPGGGICIRVPNDFTELQEAARNRLNKDEWWVAFPDHINYFDFTSLRRLLEAMNFEVVYAQGDFPMEMFLLMGDDYVGNPDVGNQCHERRVRFDMGMPPALRRRIYRALAEAGAGRDCLMFGRLRTS